MLTHKGTVTLTTPRLILRRFKPDDAGAMYNNWATDEKVPKFLSWNIHESVEETKGLVAKWVAEYDNPECYHWVIEYENTIVGAINLHAVSNKSWRAELGYSMGSRWWNRGIMTEAVRAVLKFAFDEIGFNKICALHDTENAGSGKVMQKAGMVREGHFCKHTRRKDGSWGDTDFYGIWNNNGINIQKFTKHTNDLQSKTPAIAALAGEIWREHYTPIIGEAQVEYMLEKFQSAKQIYEDITENDYVYFTSEQIKSGELSGYCAVRPKEDCLLLSKLYIRKECRGKGTARSFLDEAAALCRFYGFDKIRLTVNKYNGNSIAAYHKMGFETIDSVKNDIGGGFFMDDFVMELLI